MLDSKPVNPASEPKPALAAKPADPRGGDAMSNLVKATAAPATTSAIQRPPAPIPHVGKADPLGDLITNTRRIAAVQRALTEYGYGQLKPTGNVGSDTSAAIQRFERERKLPVTGQMSDRLVQELSAVTGRAIN
jgi:peptidoglycan hydrolase-like protein with peptidoglycan-binding domain